MNNKCNNYKFKFNNLFIPDKSIIYNYCSIENKRTQFIVSICRFIVYIYLSIILSNIHNNIKSEATNIILLILKIILYTFTGINLLLVYHVYGGIILSQN